MKMGECSRKDYISHLPESITDSILTKLPIRDAVRTSILSTKWRYQWATMTQLVFENYTSLYSDKKLAEQEVTNFIMRFLFLHHGPIYKFKLSASCSMNSTDTDQWLLFLSRKDIKELVLRLNGYHRKLPSCIYSCQKLTKLKLEGFDVKPPLRFHGFPCLKYLNLCGSFIVEVIENLISGCPLLEMFIFTNVGAPLGLAIHGPNLKHLTLNGDFTNLYLEHSPLLDVLSIDFGALAWEGNVHTKVPVTYDCLKFIDLQRINYEEMNAVLYVLHLILHSPNLQELELDIEVSHMFVIFCSHLPDHHYIFRSLFIVLYKPLILFDRIGYQLGTSHDKAAGLDFWEEVCPTNFTFKHLKSIVMSGLSNKNCVEFLKFVLGRSPVLEIMRVSPNEAYNGKMNMANEVLHFQRASPNVDIGFFD